MKKRRVKLGYHPGTALERSVMDLCSEKREGGSVFQMISGLPKPSKSSTARSNPWQSPWYVWLWVYQAIKQITAYRNHPKACRFPIETHYGVLVPRGGRGSNDKRLTETIQEQHCQERPMMESLSRGGLAIFSTILSP